MQAIVIDFLPYREALFLGRTTCPGRQQEQFLPLLSGIGGPDVLKDTLTSSDEPLKILWTRHHQKM